MPEDETLSKAELALIDKIVGALGILSFQKLLWDKVEQAFRFTFRNTQVNYGFTHATPDPLALKYLRERTFILSDKTQDRLTGNLRWELLEGIRNTESISEIKKRLDKIFAGMADYEIERIARTETLNAMNAGRLEAYEASEVTHYKMWRAAINNKRTAADSKRLHGQIQELGDPFVDPKTGDGVMHPPNRPNCRCAMIPLRKLPESIVRKGGQMYSADEMVGKIEIDITSLQKSEKRIWVKATAKRKGHYRKVRGAKKVEEVVGKPKVSEMKPDNVEEIITLGDMGAKGGIHKDNTSVVKFKDGSHGIYKIISDIGRFGEVNTYDTSKILNFDVVPESVSDDFGNGKGSCQKWIKNSEGPYDEFSLMGCKINEKHFDDLAKIFVIDTINGKDDRHKGNVVIDESGHCWAIDNEDWGSETIAERNILSLEGEMDPSDKLYSPMMEWMAKIISPMPGIFQKQPADGGKEMRRIAFSKFREKVIENMKVAINNREKIISELDNSVGGKYAENVASIRKNVEYMEEYLDGK